MHLDKIEPGMLSDFTSGKPFGRTARRRAVRGCLCVGFLLHTGVASAPADIKIERVAQWGGATKAVAVVGDRAYLGVGPRLSVLDISDPARPVELGRTAGVFRGAVQEVVVSGDYAYVSAGTLRIVDVSNPAAPLIVGEYVGPDDEIENEFKAHIRGLVVSGNYVYVGYDPDHTLHIVDVSNPKSPLRVGAVGVIAIRRVIVSGDFAFLMAGVGLVIIDVSDPTAPFEIHRRYLSGEELDMAHSGHLLYVLNEVVSIRSIEYIDVSDPAAPQTVATHRAGVWAARIHVRAGRAMLVHESGIEIYDVSIPQNFPTFLGGFLQTDRKYNEGALGFSGEHVLLPLAQGGLRTMDVSDPATPTSVGVYATAGGDRVGSLAVSGSHLYLSGARPNLRILDISDPAQPTQVAEFRLAEFGEGGVTIDGPILYLSTRFALHVLSIADPVAPEHLASVELPDSPKSLTIAGQYLFVVFRTDGIMILDVSDPQAPLQIGSYNDGSTLTGVGISGSAAFLFHSGSTLVRVLDISDLTAPFSMGYFYAVGPGGWSRMTIRGNLAYVSNGVPGMSIIDISDPLAPRWLGRYDAFGTHDLNLVADFAYLAVDSWGLEIVDVSRPTAPALIARHDTFDRAFTVSVSGSYAYVSDREGGLVIFRTTFPGDINCDGRFNGADIDPFFLALGDPVAFAARFPNCNILNADMNGDGALNGADLDPFFQCLAAGGCP